MIAGRARTVGRATAREPVNPRIKIPTYGPFEDEENPSLDLTVPQALDLIHTLTEALMAFCRRADVHDALLRTDPGPCQALLR